MGRAPTPRFSEGMRNRRLSVDRVQRTRSSFAAIAILACPTMVVPSFAPKFRRHSILSWFTELGPQLGPGRVGNRRRTTSSSPPTTLSGCPLSSGGSEVLVKGRYYRSIRNRFGCITKSGRRSWIAKGARAGEPKSLSDYRLICALLSQT